MKKMLKKSTVLIIGAYPPPYGGIGVFVRDLLNSPVKDHFNLLFLRTAKRTSKKKPFLKKFAREIKDAFSLVRYLLKDKNIKIVHIHTSSYLGFWRYSIHVLISKMFGKPVILHIHGAEFDKFYNMQNMIGKLYIRIVFNVVDKIIVLSSIWKNFYSHFVPQSKLRVVPNAIYVESFKIRQHASKDDEVKFLFLSNLERRKGVNEILQTADSIFSTDEKTKKIHFSFVGRPMEEEVQAGLKNFIRKYPDKISWTKYVTNKEKIDILSNSDVFLLPSYAEGLPISILEAMAAGLSIISTPVGSISEVIKNGENGFLIPPGDADTLKEKILELASNKDLRKEIGERNSELVKEKYSWNKIAEKIMEVYDEVLKED
jgi:glycosyltransferase involved in cell wall biosynthesis